MSDPSSLLPLIPTNELPALVAALEAHARRNYDRSLSCTEPDYVTKWSQNQAASFSAEARRVRWHYLSRTDR